MKSNCCFPDIDIKLTNIIFWSLLQSFVNSEVIDLRLHKSSFRLQTFFSHRPRTKHAHHGLVMWRHGQEFWKKCQNNWYIYKPWLWSFKTTVFETTHTKAARISLFPIFVIVLACTLLSVKFTLSWIYLNQFRNCLFCEKNSLMTA